MKEPCLFLKNHSCSQGARLLINTHLRAECNPFPETSEGGYYLYPLCCAPVSVSPREELLYTSGDPIFTPGARVLMAAAERTSIDHLALVARVTSIPWSHETITIGETVLGRLHTQSIQQTDTHPRGLTCLFAYLLVLELWPEWQASCLTHTGAYGGAFREHRLVDTIFELSLCLTSACYLPERSLYTGLVPGFL